MGEWDEIIGKRESEFTGLKGTLLRYGGATFVLLVVIQLIKALMLVFGFTSAQLDTPFLVVSAIAFFVYPVAAACSRGRRSR